MLYKSLVHVSYGYEVRGKVQAHAFVNKNENKHEEASAYYFPRANMCQAERDWS